MGGQREEEVLVFLCCFFASTDWIVIYTPFPHPNPYVEALILKVTIFGYKAFRRQLSLDDVIKKES